MMLLLALPLAAREFDAAATQAGVASADGKVDKQIKGGAWQPCAVGDILTTGDRIRTAPNSSASLLFTDKTVMRLGAGTQITLIDLSETADGKLVRKFEQQGGRSWSDVTPNPSGSTTYEVRGPNAVAAVKGTSFEVDAETGETDILCWEGQVECLAQGDAAPMRIDAQNRFQARRGKPPGRMAFNASADVDEFQSWNLQNRDKARAFFAKMPPRVKLDAVMLRNWAKQHHIKLTVNQRRKVKRMMQKHPGWGKRPHR